MRDVKTLGLVSKPNAARGAALLPELVEWLHQRNVVIRYDEATATYLNRDDGLPRRDLPEGCDVVLVLGGDGTLLSASRAIGDREIPIFAVNLGNLGFLTTIKIEDLYPELERALRGDYGVARRCMLHCEIRRGDYIVCQYEALNDAVVTKASLARMIDLDVCIDGHPVVSYKADGVIVSTPTGSTAYSLSAGGPITYPTVSALLLTPICPHMLAHRPVVMPETSEVEILNRTEDKAAYLTIDGQVGEPLNRGDRVVCRSSARTMLLVQPPKLLFFDVLREKLSWGEC